MNPESQPPLLPFDVLHQIFKNIDDPLDLMRARRVCKSWNEEINKVLPFADWKKLCSNKIRKFSLASIAAIVHPKNPKANYSDINNQGFWQDVYYHYMKLLKIKQLPTKILLPKNDLLLSSDEYMTCFDVCGLWIIYGTNVGKIYILKNRKRQKSHRVLDFHDMIKEVKISHDENNNILFLAVTRSNLIRIIYAENIFSSLGSKVCVGTANIVYCVQNDIVVKLNLTESTLVAISEISLNLNPEERVVAISSRESKIFIVAQGETQLKIFTLKDKPYSKQETSLRILFILTTSPLPVVPLNMETYVTLNGTVICTQNEYMYLYTPETDDWVTHYEPIYLDAKVTSLIVHGNYLIIGLSNGILSMYYVEEIKDLLSPNLFKREPVTAYKLDATPIIAIKVTDNCREIHITVFTQKNMFTLIL